MKEELELIKEEQQRVPKGFNHVNVPRRRRASLMIQSQREIGSGSLVWSCLETLVKLFGFPLVSRGRELGCTRVKGIPGIGIK